MADIDLTLLSGDEFVLHFGGRPNEVDAFTFANSLVAFSEAIRDINKQLNPSTRIEITIDGVGEGSFRVRLKTATTFLSALLRSTAATEMAKLFVIPIFITFIYDRYLSTPLEIKIDDSHVVIHKGDDRIIVPRDVYEKKRQLPDPHSIDKHIARGFDVLQEDPSVTEFGVTKDLEDKVPITKIPRDDFALLARPVGIISENDTNNRTVDTRERLIVLRAILARSTRKWQFVWNGVRISAPILDDDFYFRLSRHEIVFGQGDSLEVVLRIYQQKDRETGIFMNVGYEVMRVLLSLNAPDKPLPRLRV